MEKRFPNWADMLFHGPMKILVATETSTRWPGLARFLPWLAVVVVCLFIAGIRLHLLEVPLERDEGEYAYAGQLILKGIPPYELAYNMKLPGTYYAYAAGMAVFGQTAAGIHLTLLVVNSLTCVFIFLLGRKLSGVTTGMAAVASYAVMSVSPVVLGLAAHATQFVALFAVAGAWLLWKALAAGGRRLFFLAGLLFGLAFMMKQPGIVFGVFGLVVMAWDASQKGRLVSREFALALCNFSAGFWLPFLGFCLTAVVGGDFGRFWFWTFDYASCYAAGNSLREASETILDCFREQGVLFLGFWLLAAAGLWAVVRGREKRSELAFLLAFAVFSALGTTPGLYFRPHYFVVLLPAVALLAGLGLGVLRAAWLPLRLRWAPAVGLILTLTWNLYAQRAIFFQLSPQQVNQAIYQGNPFIESLQIAQDILQNSQPDARVAVLGSEPQLYFYAHRLSATGYIYTYPLMEAQPYASRMQQEMIGEIKAAKPEFIVMVSYKLSWLRQRASDLTILREMGRYLTQFYDPVAAVGRRTEAPAVLAGGSSTNAPPDSSPEAMTLFRRKAEAK